MHQYGSIVRWDAARGFGFIRSSSTQVDVFFHVRDFRGAPEPALRMAVEYEAIHVGGKGPRAMAVRPCGAAQPVGSRPAQDAPAHRGQRHTGGSSSAQLGNDASQPSWRPQTRSSHPASLARPAHGDRSARRPAAPPRAAPAAGAPLLLVLVLGWLALLAWSLWNGLLPLWSMGALLAINLLTLWFYAADKNAARTGAWRVSENQLHLLALLGGWPAAWLAQQNLRHKTSKASFRAVYWLTLALHCGALVLWLWRGPQALLF